VLEVRALSLADPARPARRLLSEVSLSLRAGEIVGLAGVAGSGASELLHALFGSFGPVDADVRLGDRRFSPESPLRSIETGLVLLGNDRRLSLVGDLAVAENATLSSLARFTRFGVVRRGAERRAAREVLGELAVRGAGDLLGPVRQLSGGNQQKVALARCLLAEPRVLLLDEPTRGIDIGAKTDVYRFIRVLAERGVGIVLVASELEELLLLSHRVLVLHRGRIVDELSGGELDRERIVASAMGASAA
jgi:ABC-type sugar transport system ATPase subunit